MVSQPTMRGRRPTKNISKFVGSRPQHSKRHLSIVAKTPDVPAGATGRIDFAAAYSLGGGGSDENQQWVMHGIGELRPGGRARGPGSFERGNETVLSWLPLGGWVWRRWRGAGRVRAPLPRRRCTS
jgi:hypothetical protein